MFFRFILYLLFVLPLSIPAQIKDSSLRIFKYTETQLKNLQQKTFFNRDEKTRFEGNKEFIALWDEIVNDPEILQYPFDSLKEVSILSPNDKSFKLITWNVFKNDETQVYFGYLLVKRVNVIKRGAFKREKKIVYNSYKLLDRSSMIRSPENHISGCEKWFGMLYYELIDCGDFYTLLGYDPNDKLIRRKFVDILYFKSNGKPIFGKDAFKFPRKNPKRLMFEYSSDVVMSLKYNESRHQIVFNHLASNKEGKILEGQVQYYGPDGSYDALDLRKGKWNLISDVDARNEKSINDNAKKPDPKKQAPIFKPK